MAHANPPSRLDHFDGESYIIVKAAPRSSKKYGETVCVAALNSDGSWVRLYPVSFVYLNEPQKFRRWDKVRYRWSWPKDSRTESRHVDPNSIQIVGRLPQRELTGFLNRALVGSLKREREQNRSLALIRPEIIEFWHQPKSQEKIAEQTRTNELIRGQLDLLAPKDAVPAEVCPYDFKYRYRDEDGIHVGTCQDWETEATFFRRRFETSEKAALDWMNNMFGIEYPRRGMALAMGTHRVRADQWLINGVIRLNIEHQTDLFA